MRLVKEGKFYEVIYDRNTQEPAPLDVSTAETVKPASVAVNEVASVFEVDENQKRRLAQRRTLWSFQLLCKFDVEVTAEVFEGEIIDPVPFIAEGDGGPALVYLRRTNIIAHPPRQGALSGSQVTFEFEVEVGRK